MGVSALGYVDINISDASGWRRMLVDVFGMQLVDRADGSIAVRLDERPHRLILRPGQTDVVATVGWEVADRPSLDALAERLRSFGVDVRGGSAQICALRAVEALYSFVDPATGMATEIFTGAYNAETPFVPSNEISGYVTGRNGLGHIVFAVDDRATATRFFVDVMGFAISDYIDDDPVHGTFLHCNPRHHSLALIDSFGPLTHGSVAHIMVEAKSEDDIGRAWDVVETEGYPIMMTMGKHSNDHTRSFYIYTPSGFAIEYGFGGREIGSNWQIGHYSSTKIWGHRPVGAVA
jgi:2,3-dihydroxybiphenyl 1,2-dioxygenase